MKSYFSINKFENIHYPYDKHHLSRNNSHNYFLLRMPFVLLKKQQFFELPIQVNMGFEFHFFF